MSTGILGRSTRRRGRPLYALPSFQGTPSLYVLPSFHGLGAAGALGATVPADCWDKPGFKTCNEQGWRLAQEKCIAGGLAAREYGGDWARCQSEQAADYAYYGCVLRICPPPSAPRPTSSGGWVWKSSTPNPSIQTFQNHLNTCLARTGFKPISADGKLGPATCGAFKTVAGQCPELFANDPISNIGICQSFTNPTRVGETTPVKDPTSDEARKLDQQFGGLPWMQPDPRATPLQQGLNQQLTGHDFLPITQTGQLDAPMCGGMRWLDVNTGSQWMPTWGQNCKAFTDPRKRPLPSSPTGPVGPTPGPAPGPVGPTPAPSAPVAQSSMLLAGGLLAALAVGGYAWWKSKTGGA